MVGIEMGEKRVLENNVPEEISPKKPCTDQHEDSSDCSEHQNTSDTIAPEEIGKVERTTEYFNGVRISDLSKRQMKKYKKCLKWNEIKKDKRAKERIKLKEKRVHAKLNNIDLGPSRKELKRSKMKDSPCKVTVCVDLGFDELMIDKDMSKTVKQILRIYTENRRAKAPMQLHLTNFNGRSEKEFSRHHGFENWDINFHSEDYIDVFPKEKLIYLSSDSENIMTKLEEDKVYIIGGLVDHNSQKGVCHDKAVRQGIAHMKLPIEAYFWMRHRKVLTINQVFEILLQLSEGKAFKETFESIIPKRIEKVLMETTSVLLDKRSEGEKGVELSESGNNSGNI